MGELSISFINLFFVIYFNYILIVITYNNEMQRIYNLQVHLDSFTMTLRYKILSYFLSLQFLLFIFIINKVFPSKQHLEFQPPHYLVLPQYSFLCWQSKKTKLQLYKREELAQDSRMKGKTTITRGQRNSDKSNTSSHANLHHGLLYVT